jgi:hypothetical protein
LREDRRRVQGSRRDCRNQVISHRFAVSRRACLRDFFNGENRSGCSL